MFASFLFPFPLRNTPAPFLWIFYKQLSCFPRDEVLFIGSPEYFQQEKHEAEQRGEVTEAVAEYYGYQTPSARDVHSLVRFEIFPDIFDELIQEFPAPNHAWRSLLTKPYEPLQRALETILAKATQQHQLEAILTWCNCPSLTKAAEKHALPVIHNELGALRLPHFQPTCYFDRQGVNGHTEAKSRFIKWCDELGSEPPNLLGREEILTLMLKDSSERHDLDSSFKFEIGLALQIEDDSNLIAFANGLDNYDLITTARSIFQKNEILIRRHPIGHMQYRAELGTIDDSPSSLDFIKRSKRIATINSSVALEALLFDRPTCVLGDNPFQHLARTSIEALKHPETGASQQALLGLNHAVFGYLVPYDLLFDASYYRWRLTGPTESEIVRFHQQFYLAQHEDVPEWEGLERDLGVLLSRLHIRRIVAEKQAYQNELVQFQQRLEQQEQALREKDEQIQAYAADIQAHTADIQAHAANIQAYEAELKAYDAAIQGIYQSHSWRLLAPYRFARAKRGAPLHVSNELSEAAYRPGRLNIPWKQAGRLIAPLRSPWRGSLMPSNGKWP